MRVMLLLIVLGGCAPVVRSAVPLTPADPAGTTAWVFVDTADNATTGVYHCTTAAGSPECHRARIR